MRAAHAAELRRRPDDDGSGETNDFEAEAAAAEEAEQNKGDLMLARIELKNLREKAAAQAEELDQCKIKLQQAQAKAKEQAQALQQAKARPPSSGPSSGRPASGASRPPSAGQMSLAAQAHSQRAAQVSESYPNPNPNPNPTPNPNPNPNATQRSPSSRGPPRRGRCPPTSRSASTRR